MLDIITQQKTPNFSKDIAKQIGARHFICVQAFRKSWQSETCKSMNEKDNVPPQGLLSHTLISVL